MVFPFESSFPIIPLAAIGTILAFYTLLLIKLKPSIEDIEREEDTFTEPKKLEKVTAPSETDKKTNGEPTSSARKEHTEASQTEVDSINGDVEENPKKKNTDREAKKSFFLFAERDFDGCPHKFGYLRSLRKNAPIPDECFGCPQMLECLTFQKNK